MKRISLFLGVVALLAGCATQPARTVAPGTAFTGEVWTWDEKENTVTLRQGTQFVRVKIQPDQFRGLQLHQVTTVRGDLAPPADLIVLTGPVPMTAVPRGAPEQVEVTGSVTAVDAEGRMAISSSRGPMQVLAASGADTRFRPGMDVTVRTTIQPVDMVVTSRAPQMVATDAAASPASEPGDYSVVRGRVLSVDSAGSIRVESPAGPLDFRVADISKYRPGDSVQVRTIVTPK